MTVIAVSEDIFSLRIIIHIAWARLIWSEYFRLRLKCRLKCRLKDQFSRPAYRVVVELSADAELCAVLYADGFAHGAVESDVVKGRIVLRVDPALEAPLVGHVPRAHRGFRLTTVNGNVKRFEFWA